MYLQGQKLSLMDLFSIIKPAWLLMGFLKNMITKMTFACSLIIVAAADQWSLCQIDMRLYFLIVILMACMQLPPGFPAPNLVHLFLLSYLQTQTSTSCLV